MLTRCPSCETAFRVTPEQLKLRQGKVRCGECQHVFNALESLVEEIAVTPASTFEPTIEPSIEPATESAIESAIGPSLEPEPVIEPSFDPEPAPASLPQPSPPFEPLLHDLPENSSSSSLRWLWMSGSAAAILALALQTLIHFRVELAVLAPASRPALEALCSPFSCTVGLPSNVELMTIESSDLQPDVEQKNTLLLTATLRNRAPFAQQFPHLELSLTDVTDKAIARRVLAPADYLLPDSTPERTLSKGLPSGEFSIKLPLDGSQVAANGYRLYVFYP